ncbi:TetR/AcrR family transcriptional regulator [Clavibacter tessellarius]|uniref:TetR/AcrR family transcriptional regulator n=1 Tax=Clavibacter tessellarius TaxID=31965 RepID=UPI00324C861B
MPDAPSDPPAPDPDPVAASPAAPPTGGTAGDSPATRSTASARDRILDAFEELLVQQGERGTTLESVAAAAGVSKGGLLYHFGGKEALVEGSSPACRRSPARTWSGCGRRSAARSTGGSAGRSRPPRPSTAPTSRRPASRRATTRARATRSRTCRRSGRR